MRYGRWEIVKELGQGGQGTAYLVLDTKELNLDALVDRLRQSIADFGAIKTRDDQKRAALTVLEVAEIYLKRESPPYTAVLKLLHPAARNDVKALGRLRNEIEILGRIDHPNVMKALDAAPDEGWFVMPYYPEGPLSAHPRFAGRVLDSLLAFRTLVTGVAALHEMRVVHRDIKPENIFVSGQRLVLGDFGFVYFADPAKTRLSDSYEKVGTTDWMPGWAMTMRLDDVRPSFDVFSLGKVLWSLVSGRPKMRLWYFDQPDFDLVRLFPNDERMQWVNRLLAGSVREHERDVWRDARQFLNELDAVLAILRRGGQMVSREVPRYCRVCGHGVYELAGREGSVAVHNMGFNPAGSELLRVFQCTNCGHLDIFRVTDNPPGWGEVRR
jgi:serine/threonine protein kinase